MPSFDGIAAVARLMEGFPGPWFVSGGWAMDLFVGRVTREHEDREVGGRTPGSSESGGLPKAARVSWIP